MILRLVHDHLATPGSERCFFFVCLRVLCFRFTHFPPRLTVALTAGLRPNCSGCLRRR